MKLERLEEEIEEEKRENITLKDSQEYSASEIADQQLGNRVDYGLNATAIHSLQTLCEEKDGTIKAQEQKIETLDSELQQLMNLYKDLKVRSEREQLSLIQELQDARIQKENEIHDIKAEASMQYEILDLKCTSLENCKPLIWMSLIRESFKRITRGIEQANTRQFRTEKDLRGSSQSSFGP